MLGGCLELFFPLPVARAALAVLIDSLVKVAPSGGSAPLIDDDDTAKASLMGAVEGGDATCLRYWSSSDKRCSCCARVVSASTFASSRTRRVGLAGGRTLPHISQEQKSGSFSYVHMEQDHFSKSRTDQLPCENRETEDSPKLSLAGG